MKVLELFAGTRSIGKAFEAHDHEVYSVEWSKDFENIDLYADIGTITAEQIVRDFGLPDVIWASPDCTTFSLMAISHHRRKKTGNRQPGSGERLRKILRPGRPARPGAHRRIEPAAIRARNA